jgi:hypothetical protein
MQCPHCGFENNYSKNICVNCKKDMTAPEGLRNRGTDGIETAGRLASDVGAPKLPPVEEDYRLAIFLSVVTMMLLLSALSVTWYRVVTVSTYDLGIFVGESGWGVFDYSSNSALSALMSSTGVGVAIAALLILAIVASCLLKLSWTSILLSGASVATILVVEFRFILRIQDAFSQEIDWSEVKHGAEIGWYMVMLASGLQMGALVLLVVDEHRRHRDD